MMHTLARACFHGKMQLNVFCDDLCALKGTRDERERREKKGETEMFAATAIDRKK